MVKEWEKVQIGECFDFKNGLNKGKDYFGTGTPIINYMDVYKKRGMHKEDIKGRVTLSSEEISRFKVEKNDVFFTRTSETPEEVGFASVLLDDIENCVFSGFVLRARPKNQKLYPAFCQYCFMTNDIRQAIEKSCTYTTRALTNGKVLSMIEIALPPYDEQLKISEAISDIDELISSLKKLIAKKKAIKQGAMQQLLTKEKRVHDDSKWIEIKLGEKGSLIKEAINPQLCPDEQFWEYSMPAFDVDQLPVKQFGKNMHSNRIAIKGEVLLFNKLNVRQKRVWNIKQCAPNALCSSEFLPYRSSEICLDLLKHILLADKVTNDFIGMSTGTSNSQKRITPQNFLDYVVTIPENIEEQKTIASLLTEMDLEIAGIQKKINKMYSIKQGVMQQLLTGIIRLE